MKPWELVFFYGSLPFGLFVVACNAENLHSVAVFFVVLLHLRHAFDAPTAPRTPEVEYDILSAKRREREFVAVDVGEGEVGSEVAFLYGFAGFKAYGIGVCFLHQEVDVGLEATIACRGVKQCGGTVDVGAENVVKHHDGNLRRWVLSDIVRRFPS